MDDVIKQEILQLQDQLNAGAITAEEYMAAVNRLTNPDGDSSYELPSRVSEDSFYDDLGDEKIEVYDPFDTAPPVPGSQAPKGKNMAVVISLVVILAIIAIMMLTIIAVWASMRSHLGY